MTSRTDKTGQESKEEPAPILWFEDLRRRMLARLAERIPRLAKWSAHSAPGVCRFRPASPWHLRSTGSSLKPLIFLFA